MIHRFPLIGRQALNLAQPFVVACLFASCVVAQNWTQFRGAEFGAYTGSSPLPTKWDAKHIAWKTSLPGPGASSPVAFGNRIYVTCYTGYGVNRSDPGDPSKLRRHVLCINSDDGEVVWKKTIGPESKRNQFTQWAVALHGYASSTPAVDEDGIYVFLGDAGCVAFEHDGTKRWTFDCGRKTHMFGSGSSPVIYKNLVIVNASPESGDLIAIDKSTGKEAWRASGIRASWGTPAIYQNLAGSSELALSIRGEILAFKPETGERLWSCSGISGYVCPSIAARDGILYAIGGKNQKRTLAVRSGGSGDVSDSHVLWKIPKGSNVGSPVIHEGHVFWAKENGVVYCADVKSGKILHEQRLQPASGTIYASPLLAGGNLYYVSRDRGTYVVAAKPEFKLVAHNLIEGDDSVFNASAVPSDDGLLLRSDKFLYFVRSESKAAEKGKANSKAK